MKRSVTHSTFTIDRHFDATPARVFEAFSDPASKARWFHGPSEWGPPETGMDFRVGGREFAVSRPKDGPPHRFDAIYQDIVPGERIVYTYEMRTGDRRISVSLATIELTPDGKGTRVLLTEMGAFLDGLDAVAQREAGTKGLFDQLARALAG